MTAAWTGEELDRLRALEAQGLSVEEIAGRLGRGREDVEERLTLIHTSPAAPSYGPDEEGDVPVPEGARADDSAAWVHVDRKPPVADDGASD
jgi:hypothetical protein